MSRPDGPRPSVSDDDDFATELQIVSQIREHLTQQHTRWRRWRQRIPVGNESEGESSETDTQSENTYPDESDNAETNMAA